MSIYIIIVAIGVLGAILLGLKAMGGPNASKAAKRRMEMLKERHAEGIAATAQAQIRKLMPARASRDESLASTLIPKPALMRQRLERTGKEIKLGKYMLGLLGILALVATAMAFKGVTIMLAIVVSLFVVFAVPHFAVSFLIKRRLNQFNSIFPDAIELMVRGLRSGLPVTETLGIVASEISGPVGIEFRAVADKMKIGKTMDAALQETSD